VTTIKPDSSLNCAARRRAPEAKIEKWWPIIKAANIKGE
jgi:hypothetical protein